MALHQPLRSKADRGRSSATPAGAREIPDKLYFRIGEVAKLCGVAPYVLRFWESEFPQLKPNKGGTGQRLYRRRDVEMAIRVKTLLHDEGYTIAGARQSLKSELRPKEVAATATEAASVVSRTEVTPETRPDLRTEKLQKLRADMQSLLTMLGQSIPSRPKPAPVQSIRSAKPRPAAPRTELASLFDSLE